MSEFTVETYLQIVLCYSVLLWAAYAVYLALSLLLKKTHTKNFFVASICFLLISEEVIRVTLMLNGLLSEELKPLWLTLLMNVPFWPIIYEIFLRKAALSVLDAWKNAAARRRGVKPRCEHDRVHSAVRRPGRSASDHSCSD